jgi:tetrahydromethanopterin S-methyltransferase subunit H
MFDYSVKQKTYEISGVKIGGEPGEVPTVMVGSMFYNGDRNVSDHAKGLFNKEKAEKQIKDAEEITKATGLSTMMDLVAENKTAASNYLNFVVDVTEMPIFLDVVSEKAQAETIRYAAEIGCKERIILNSITPHSGKIVYNAIKDTKLKSAVILTLSNKYILSSNKDTIIDEVVPKAEEAGVKNIIIDTVVIDIPTLGVAAKAIDRVKDKYGYPCGCGAHNALASWKRLREKYVKEAQTIVRGVINTLPSIIGADFVLFGALKNAKTYYPAVAMVDAAYSQLMMEKKIRPNRSHPRYKIG